MTNLVVGGTGFLGQAISKRFDEYDISYISTSRAPKLNNELALNLLDLKSFKIPGHVQAVIWVAGVSGKAVNLNFSESREINVTNTSYWIEKLLKAGIRVFFISTSAVFNSDQNLSFENDTPSPSSEYGLQKREVEKNFYGEEGFTVIRPTKILGSRSQLFINWLEKIQTNKSIEINLEAKLSPISCEFFVNSLVEILKFPKDGVVHLSGAESISYLELLADFLEISGIPQNANSLSSLVEPQKPVDAHILGVSSNNKSHSKLQSLADFLGDLS